MQYPLYAWLNYDMQFRITAASDPTICWNVRHTDLWLKWITPFVKQAQSEWYPNSYCGSTSHHPETAIFTPVLHKIVHDQLPEKGPLTPLGSPSVTHTATQLTPTSLDWVSLVPQQEIFPMHIQLDKLFSLCSLLELSSLIGGRHWCTEWLGKCLLTCFVNLSQEGVAQC